MYVCMWVEVVVGSLLYSERFFFRFIWFSPTLPNFNSFWNAQTRLNELLRTPKSFVGKQITPPPPLPLSPPKAYWNIFGV